MALTTFSGPVKSNNGFITQGAVDLTADTTLTVNDHAGRILTINDADGVFTLPTITADNVGSTFYFVVETAATDMDIKTDGTDKFIGFMEMVRDDATSKAFVPGATNDVITMNGSTKGGAVGTVLTITAVALAKYHVNSHGVGSGTTVTPFADA